MIDIFKKLAFKESSKKVAKERLQFILIHDRIQLSPKELTKMKEEIITVVSKYVEVDEKDLEMSLQRSEDNMALQANIPIRNRKN